jgi:hypothetical protein
VADSVQTSQLQQQTPEPRSDLKALDKLVGTWKVSGDPQGQVRFEWMEGGYFLVQHVELEYGGRQIKGTEIIGHLRRIDEAPSSEIWSRFYSTTDGLTLDYVYQLAGDALTIWYGEKDSPNHFTGKFSEDGNSYSGEWEWPGGGYKATATRVG